MHLGCWGSMWNLVLSQICKFGWMKKKQWLNCCNNNWCEHSYDRSIKLTRIGLNVTSKWVIQYTSSCNHMSRPALQLALVTSYHSDTLDLTRLFKRLALWHINWSSRSMHRSTQCSMFLSWREPFLLPCRSVLIFQILRLMLYAFHLRYYNVVWNIMVIHLFLKYWCNGLHGHRLWQLGSLRTSWRSCFPMHRFGVKPVLNERGMSQYLNQGLQIKDTGKEMIQTKWRW